MKILIIGNGAWPTKIFNGLYSKSNKDKINQISAREFLSQDSFKYSVFDCIWIATSPENQINILSKIANYSEVVILEKPLFTTISEYDRLNFALGNFKGVAQMSTIWLYSPLWKNLEIPLENISSISIRHKYSDLRVYCSPIFDWIPHDLYLLNALGMNISQNIEFRTGYSSPGKLSMHFKLKPSFCIDIFFEKSEQNDFSWEIQCHDSSKIEINFSNRTFKEIRAGCRSISHFDSPDVNTANFMLKDYLTKTESNLQYSIDSHFYLLNILSLANNSLN